MLISDKLNTIIRILLINVFEDKPDLTISSITREAKITGAMTKRLLLRLERSEYIKIKGRVIVINPIKLMKAWSYTYSIKEIECMEYVTAERSQYIISKISNWARANNINYAFTLFSATEQVSPYVAPTNTYLYINKDEIELWEKFFRENRMLPAEKKGNVVCFLVNEDYLKGVLKVRGTNIVSLPQLYADLMSFGGRGEEAAKEVMEIIKKQKKSY
ncbi:MAG: type IV toxin-antitoxin system AbiEi family antitoxin [Nanoarchaeota archaeon]|nr:type IV toxin-antitoxin system AbiEi family antitoxin [Nanoarchaeota archaeon]